MRKKRFTALRTEDSQRIADKVLAAVEARSVEPLIEWLVTLGCTWAVRSAGGHAVDGLTGVRVGFALADPVTMAVQTGFALAGPFWPQAYPGLLVEVNRRWGARMKAAKEEW